MYFKIALFLAVPLQGSTCQWLPWFLQSRGRSVKKKPSFLGKNCSLEKLVFLRVPVKKRERRGSQASDTQPPIFLAAPLDLGFFPPQLDPKVRDWVQEAECAEGGQFICLPKGEEFQEDPGRVSEVYVVGEGWT